MLSITFRSVLCCLLFAHTEVFTIGQPDYATRNFNTISSIYNLTVYPNNAAIIAQGSSAVPAGLFNANATGRVTPVGSFQGFNQSVEYFFGLAPEPPGPTNATIQKAVISSFTSGCAEVASSVVYLECYVSSPGQSDNGNFIATLKQVSLSTTRVTCSPL